MKGHLNETALVDFVVEGAGDAARWHVSECAECARRVAEARETLSWVRSVEVPEPAAFFWTDFRWGVRSRMTVGEAAVLVWRRWLVPLAAMAAALVLAVTVRYPHRPVTHTRAAASSTLQPWSSLPVAEEDAALPIVEGLLLDNVAVGWEEGGGLDPFLAGLTDEESAALTRELQTAVRGGDL